MDKLDKKDEELLKLLNDNCKAPVQQLAKKTGLPPTTVHNRIKHLEHLGFIKRYTIEQDWNKLEKSVVAYILVSVEYVLPTGGRVQQADVAHEIKSIAGIEEVSILTGEADLLAKARVKDLTELNDIVVNKLRNVQGVDKTQTMIVLSSV